VGRVRFGVLGPLTVWTDNGAPVRVPEAKVRALLADLLVAGGRLISTDRLIEDLWGEAPPGKPVPALRAKISQLRRVLDEAEPGGRGLVEFRSRGYRLAVDADAVDIGRFAALAAQARTAADPRTRAALLTEALDLWRGEALADFADEPFARLTATELHEQQLAAREDRAAARLELGEHAEVASELAGLSARHPQRERLHAIYLRALYGSGRQAEALEAYARLRTQLADELGVDPSPELSALHQSMLRQEPQLNAPRPRARGNLPAPVSTLMGRDGAPESVRALLETERLVTLTGPGGVGKTRLSLAVAQAAADSFPDGVWLVELATVDTAAGMAGVADCIAAALRLRDEASRSGLNAPDRLSEALRDKHLLILLDNCEHLVDAAAALADRLLAAAPGLRLLVTSREPLHIPGEHLWAVPTLDLPEQATPESVRESGAARLFIARALAASPGFAPDGLVDADAAAIAAICRRLDGLPLALELAASRVRGLGVRELAARLDDRFDLLTARNRRAPTRHQTLRAVIDWSWNLLEPAEQVVLRRLAVHADGCTLAAAEAVCADENAPATEIVDVLARLVDRSLVTVSFPDGRPRYRLLESVADYSRERLAQAAETDEVRQRARRHHAAFAERADSGLRGAEQRDWLRSFELELPNLRAALDDALHHQDSVAIRQLAGATSWYLFLKGRLREAHQLLDTASAGGHSAVLATWRDGMAVLSGMDRHEARDRPDITSSVDRARAEWFLDYARVDLGDFSGGTEVLDRALRACHAADDRWGTAAVLSNRARRAFVCGDLTAARRDATESARLFGELGDQWGQLQAMDPLAWLAEITGDYSQAERMHRDGLRIAGDLGLCSEVAERLSGLGRIALLTGDLAAAEAHHRRAAELAAGVNDPQGEVYAEFGLALTARRQGRLNDAERLWQRQLAWSRQASDDPGAALALSELGFIAEVRDEPETARNLHSEGLTLAHGTGDPRAVALALEGLAGARSLVGEAPAAARLLGRAAAAREAVGAPLPPAERYDVDRITTRARKAAGAAVFDSEFASGHALGSVQPGTAQHDPASAKTDAAQPDRPAREAFPAPKPPDSQTVHIGPARGGNG
jgi:predicted ATPase/DNA-binding SARP family transcriptional activator